MERLLAMVVLTLALSSGAFGQPQGNEARSDSLAVQAVLQAGRELDDALIQGDMAKLEHLLSDAIVQINSFGLFNKAQWLSSIKEGRAKYISFEDEGLNVRLYGETAVVTGIRYRNREGRADYRGARHLFVWVKRQGHWQLVAHIGTLIEEP